MGLISFIMQLNSTTIRQGPQPADDGLWHDNAYFTGDDGLWHDNAYFTGDDGLWHDNAYF